MLITNGVAEVAQQSKARKKDDFLIAFSPVIAEATATAYKGATSEVQQKLRRVVEVWRQRQIFDGTIQAAIESRIDGTSLPSFPKHPLIHLYRSRQITQRWEK
jgi:serine protease inhibitor